MEDLIKKFLDYLKEEKKLSKNTLESYKRDIKNYVVYLNSKEMTILNSNKEIVNGYIESLEHENKLPSTISRNIASLRSFYKYLYNDKLVIDNPTKDIEAPKIEKKSPTILSNEQVELLLEQPKPVDLKGTRDKAMLELVYATGVRVTELINLNLSDVDFKSGYIKCTGLHNKERIIPIGNMALKALNEYVQNARGNMLNTPDNSSLFVNVNGNRLTRQGFWKIIKYYQEQANISVDITPHTLRHSFAVHLLENGADINVIQEMLGHVEKSSTQVYMSITQNRLKDVYNKAHPRA